MNCPGRFRRRQTELGSGRNKHTCLDGGQTAVGLHSRDGLICVRSPMGKEARQPRAGGGFENRDVAVDDHQVATGRWRRGCGSCGQLPDRQCRFTHLAVIGTFRTGSDGAAALLEVVPDPISIDEDTALVDHALE